LCRIQAAKVLSAVYGELQGRMLEYLATGMTFSDVDNCSEGMLDQMAIYLKIEWYDSAADIETKRKLVRTAIEIQRYAGTVKAVREQVETIYKKARIEEWFSYGGTPGFWKLYVDITDDQETYHTAAEMEKLLGYTKRCTAHLEHIIYTIEPHERSPAYIAAGNQMDNLHKNLSSRNWLLFLLLFWDKISGAPVFSGTQAILL